jgi:hypothetical protein
MHRVAAWTHGLQRATPMVAGAASARCWRRTYPVDRPTSAATGWSLSMCRCRRGRRRAARSASVARAVTWTGLVSHSMGLGCSAMGASSGATVSAQGSSRPRQRVTTSSAHAPPAAYYSPLTTYYYTSHYLLLTTWSYSLFTTHYSLLTYHVSLTTHHLLLLTTQVRMPLLQRVRGERDEEVPPQHDTGGRQRGGPLRHAWLRAARPPPGEECVVRSA